MSNINVGDIVQQIVESLSDGNAELMLAVLKNKESSESGGVAITPSAFQAPVAELASGVNKLVYNARGLAENEYIEYPMIKEQILQAAAEAEGASNGLVAAAKHLIGNSNSTDAWDGLGKACRTIAYKTAVLLQIVYGAELEKMFMQTERAKMGLDSLLAALPAGGSGGAGPSSDRNPPSGGQNRNTPGSPPAGGPPYSGNHPNNPPPNGPPSKNNPLANNPEPFADDLSKALAEACKVADLMRDKAAIEPGPLTKQELGKGADKIEDQARNLVPTANKAIQLAQTPNADPGQTQGMYNKLRNDLQQLRSDIDNLPKQLPDGAKAPAIPVAAEKVEKAIPKLLQAANNLANAKSAPPSVPDSNRNGRPPVGPGEAVGGPGYPNAGRSPGPDSIPPSKRGESPNVNTRPLTSDDEAPLADMHKAANEILSGLEPMDWKPKDPREELAKEAAQMIPKLDKLGDVIANGDDPEDLLQDLAGRHKRLPPLAQKANFDPNDKKAVDNSLNNIGDLFKDLFKVVKKPDAGKAGQADQDIAKIKSALSDIISACDVPSDNVMSAMAVQKLRDLLTDIAKQTQQGGNANPFNNSNKDLAKALGDLLRGAKTNDPAAITSAAREVANIIKDIKNAAGTLPDPNARRQAEQKADELLGMLTGQLIPDLKAMNNGDQKAGQRVNDTIDNMKGKMVSLAALGSSKAGTNWMGLLQACKNVSDLLSQLVGKMNCDLQNPLSTLAGFASASYNRGGGGGFGAIEAGGSKIVVQAKERPAMASRYPNILAATTHIGEELKKLGAAAQAGRKQELIEAGKNVRQYVMDYTKELKSVAANCRDPVMQDKLYKQITALQNFSIQLKIMASVKASSTDASSDTQLVFIANNLQQIMSQSLSTVTSVILL